MAKFKPKYKKILALGGGKGGYSTAEGTFDADGNKITRPNGTSLEGGTNYAGMASAGLGAVSAYQNSGNSTEGVKSGIDAVAGVVTPWYGYAKQASNMGRGMIPTDENGQIQDKYRSTDALMKPIHEQGIDAISKGNYADAAGSFLGAGFYSPVKAHFNKDYEYKMGGELTEYTGADHEQGGVNITSNVQTEGGENESGGIVNSKSYMYNKNLVKGLLSEGIDISKYMGKTPAQAARIEDKKYSRKDDSFTKAALEQEEKNGTGKFAIQNASKMIGNMINSDAQTAKFGGRMIDGNPDYNGGSYDNNNTKDYIINQFGNRGLDFNFTADKKDLNNHINFHQLQQKNAIDFNNYNNEILNNNNISPIMSKFGGKIKKFVSGGYYKDANQEINDIKNQYGNTNTPYESPSTMPFNTDEWSKQNWNPNISNIDNKGLFDNQDNQYSPYITNREKARIGYENDKRSIISNGNDYSQPQQSNFDYSQAIGTGANMLGSLYDIGRGLKGSTPVSPDLVNPSLVDYSSSKTEALRNNNQTYKGMTNDAKNSNSPAITQALKTQLAGQKYKADSDIINQFDTQQFNQNAGIKNQSKYYNAAAITSAKDKSQMESDIASNQVSSGLSGIGQAVAQSTSDIKNDKGAINAIGSKYPDWKYNTKTGMWKHNTSGEQVSTNKLIQK